MGEQTLINLSWADSFITLMLPASSILPALARSEPEPSPDPEGEIVRALREPIGQSPLREMLTGHERIVVVADDATRRTPTELILPHLLNELNEAGIPDGQVTLLIALGTHRPMSRDEILQKYGPEATSRIPIENHDWADPAKMVDLGSTPHGVPVAINRQVLEADFVIGVGSIGPHHLVGYSGGAKIIQPGVSGAQTTAEVHLMSVRLRRNFLGQTDNPVRQEIDQIGREAGLRSIFNTVLDDDGQLVGAFFGNPAAAFAEGVATCQEGHTQHLPAQADIVVASSTPYDVDFWQAHKTLYPADIAVRDGGTVILVTPCWEGVARTHPSILEFAHRDAEDIDQLVRQGEIVDGTAAALAMAWAKVRSRAQIVLVSDGISDEEARALGFSRSANVQASIDQAFHAHGPDATVTVLDHAPETVPVIGGHQWNESA